jgi:YfiH family protein
MLRQLDMSNVSDEIYHFKKFLKYPKIVHGISSVAFGPIKKKALGDLDGYSVSTLKFAKAVGLAESTIIFMQQVHSGTVTVIESGTNLNVPDTDALVTDKKLLTLAVLTADCLPILFYDPINEVIAAAHAGYKGILANIIGNTVASMQSQFKSQASDLIVGIGPCIEMKCYEVGLDRIHMFQKAFPFFETFFTEKEGKYFLNLGIIAQKCLMKEGILKENIESMDICTKCDPHFYSFRGGDTDKRFVSIIGLV